MRSRVAETIVVSTCLAALLASLIIGSRWPLVGDSVLMHYVVWLTRHGFAPYRDVAEMNLPLTYVAEGAAMSIFGAGAAGWRMYDGFLVFAIAACCCWLLRQRGIASGLFAAALFATVHLQDGIHMAGQRDLLVTVLQAAAGCVLLGARKLPSTRVQQPSRRVQRFALVSFGLLSTAAACIKPPAILFSLLGLAWCGRRSTHGDREGGQSAGVLTAFFAGACLPVLLCIAYLLHFGALSAFLQDLHGLIAYHASLERRSAGFLVGHIFSPVLPLFLLTLVASALPPRSRWCSHDTLFALSAAAGFVSYLVQGKGFPYQRYPFLFWALLLCASRLWSICRKAAFGWKRGPTVAGQRASRVPTIVSLLSVGSGAVLMATFLLRSAHFSHVDPYSQLKQDLAANGATLLDGRVQCLDTAGPCIGALYESRLTQSTGFLYDCYLLDGRNAVVQQQRALLEREWAARPPRLIVLTDSNCFTGPRTFDKYKTWPWMQQQLATYRIVLEQHSTQPLYLWSRPENPYAYRILLREQDQEHAR